MRAKPLYVLIAIGLWVALGRADAQEAEFVESPRERLLYPLRDLEAVQPPVLTLAEGVVFDFSDNLRQAGIPVLTMVENKADAPRLQFVMMQQSGPDYDLFTEDKPQIIQLCLWQPASLAKDPQRSTMVMTWQQSRIYMDPFSGAVEEKHRRIGAAARDLVGTFKVMHELANR